MMYLLAQVEWAPADVAAVLAALVALEYLVKWLLLMQFFWLGWHLLAEFRVGRRIRLDKL